MKVSTCQHCGRRIVEAASDDTGLPHVLDPRPLSGVGEVLAILAGRATFDIRMWGGRLTLGRRDQFRIRGAPAGSKRVDVVVEHECQPDDLPRMRSAVNMPDTKPVELIDPPF